MFAHISFGTFITAVNFIATVLFILILVLIYSFFILSLVKMGKRKVSYNSNWEADFKW